MTASNANLNAVVTNQMDSSFDRASLTLTNVVTGKEMTINLRRSGNAEVVYPDGSVRRPNPTPQLTQFILQLMDVAT